MIGNKSSTSFSHFSISLFFLLFALPDWWLRTGNGSSETEISLVFPGLEKTVFLDSGDGDLSEEVARINVEFTSEEASQDSELELKFDVLEEALLDPNRRFLVSNGVQN